MDVKNRKGLIFFGIKCKSGNKKPSENEFEGLLIVNRILSIADNPNGDQ
jgi:hypothetical protein